ncbi:MAG: thioredoxin family protein [Candidatus Cloacimonetes bacterium]|nr:thioredoxin family protein [Candidatus Cloacimonadota bacterium]
MKIEVLGSGCAKCNQMYANVKQAASELGLDCELEKVTDLNRIVACGVMMTPALVVDGVVKLSGKAPGVAKLKEMLGER